MLAAATFPLVKHLIFVVFAALDLIDNSCPDADDIILHDSVPVNEGLARGAYELNDVVVAYTERSGVPDILAYGSVPVKLKLPCMDTVVPSRIRLSVKYEALGPASGFK